MNPTAHELYEQFKLIEANYTPLMQRCTTEAQREQLRASYTQARTNYNLAMLRVFTTDEAELKRLQGSLANARQQINDALSGLENIAQALNSISQAAALGTSLVLAAG